MSLSNVLCVILGGGRGTRLYPLTKLRSKPAVPLAGKYRIIDITISNAINSNLRNIFVLTQFNSASLNKHITQTYSFDTFTGGSVEILAAEQTPESSNWYQGTADAIRQQLRRIAKSRYDHVLILSGDHLYRMDYRNFIRHHILSNADLTVGSIPITDDQASAFGIMAIDRTMKINRFVEKPSSKQIIDSLHIPADLQRNLEKRFGKQASLLASMGIYVFKRDVLVELLQDEAKIDFGKHIIPDAIQRKNVYGYPFAGYWEDIGSIRSFFEANLQLVEPTPNFYFYQDDWPIYTRSRVLPATRTYASSLDRCIITEGCLINRAQLSQCVIGLRSIIQQGARLERVVYMGSDLYERNEDLEAKDKQNVPRMGIGAGTVIRNAIIDKNVCIGENVRIENRDNIEDCDKDLYCIREGIVIVPKNTVIPSGTVI